jgi:hypothetical protein
VELGIVPIGIWLHERDTTEQAFETTSARVIWPLQVRDQDPVPENAVTTNHWIFCFLWATGRAPSAASNPRFLTGERPACVYHQSGVHQGSPWPG